MLKMIKIGSFLTELFKKLKCHYFLGHSVQQKSGHTVTKLFCVVVHLNCVCTYLASLCNIADVSMTTKSTETEVASTYEFDSSGNILSSTPSHLPQGY